MIYPKEELFGEINKKAIVFIINTCYNVKRSFAKDFFCAQGENADQARYERRI